MPSLLAAPAVNDLPVLQQEGNGAAPVRILKTDAEALSEATRLAGLFRKGAIERDRERRLPFEEIESLSRSGLLSIMVPREYGGPEVSAATIGEVFRIISAADPSIGQIPQNHFSWTRTFDIGTPEQKAFFFGRILAGERIGNAHAELNRKRPRDYDTKIERVPGGYVITGKKHYSTGAIFAHWIPTFGKDEAGRRIQLFSRRESPGLTVVNDWAGMGQRTTASGTTLFEGVFVPDQHVLPIYKIMEEKQRPSYSSIGQLIHTAVDVGIAEEALADAREYILTKNRPWTENPYDEHAKEPFVVKSFGELTAKLHIAQILLQRAGEAIDAFRRDRREESYQASQFAIAEARIFAGNAAVEIADELFALNGAQATQEKYGLDRHWRNARTHTLHDPFRWKYFHIGNFHLNGVPPPNGSYF